MQRLPSKLLPSFAAVIALQAPQVAHASKMGSGEGIVLILVLAGILVILLLGALVAIAISRRRHRGRHCAILVGLAALYAAIAVGSIMPCMDLLTCAFFGSLDRLAGLLYLPLVVMNIVIPLFHYRTNDHSPNA
jgi:ABC-type glycerol-3-phosphate transport system permease component